MRMIYYYPAPIQENAKSASGIRPRRMLEAFKNIGYTVDCVTGHSKERNEAIKKVKENVKRNIKYDFAYGEDTTLPFAMNDPSHLPLYPFMDYSFWAWMKSNNIPFGCFYRDMYWRFPEYRKGIDFHKWAAPLPFHYLDVYMLKKYASKIFFPTKKCANDLPFELPYSMVEELPPGGKLCDSISVKNFSENGILNLFYVGGILPPSYDMKPLIDFVSVTDLSVSLVICCRENEYKEVITRGIYKNIFSQSIKIIHKSGSELDDFWDISDLFVIMREKARYLKNAMPFKVFEAIGHAIPIIISEGSAAADFVKQYDFGWKIEPTKEELNSLIKSILNNPEILEEKKQSLLAHRNEHTWEARAKHVSETLLFLRI
jgi:glycosyltransferase involved in cell wall biosynthesis